ncbi:MAG: insulinase family protein [Acidobacteria bacterium]|nr:insulinase family protein [Acidobacteriota bacterium]
MRTLAIVLCLILPAPAAAQQADRSRPPALGPAPPVTPPAIQRRALSNGLRVWIVEHHEVPVVQVDLIVRSGSAADPSGKFGLASLTAAMLDEGAGARDALQLADAIDHLGASLSAGISVDASSVRLHVPVARLNDALPIMADVALRPTFPQRELDRLRNERLTDLQQGRDDPGEIVRAAFPLVVFGPQHRYGTGGVGTTVTLKSFTADDLRAFHAAHFRPSNGVLIVVGDVTADAVLPLFEQAFGSWASAGAASTAAAVTAPPQLRARRVVIVDKPESAQSQVRIGWVGAPRSSPDFYILQVMNTILGGSFTSRLNQNLREQHGYAYGAGSGFDMRRVSGLFFAGAGVQTDKTAESLTEFFNELNGMLKPIPAEEVTKAKNYLALSYPRDFETTRDIAAQLATSFVYDLPEDFFNTYVQKIQAVTPEQVQAAAKTYVQPGKFVVVVVGDRKAIEAPVKALNLGPVTFMRVEEALR